MDVDVEIDREIEVAEIRRHICEPRILVLLDKFVYRPLPEVRSKIPDADIENRRRSEQVGVAQSHSGILVVRGLAGVWQVLRILLENV